MTDLVSSHCNPNSNYSRTTSQFVYDVEEDDLFISDVSIVSGGGILTDVIDEVGVWEYLPEKPGDVTFEFTVSDG